MFSTPNEIIQRENNIISNEITNHEFYKTPNERVSKDIYKTPNENMNKNIFTTIPNKIEKSNIYDIINNNNDYIKNLNLYSINSQGLNYNESSDNENKNDKKKIDYEYTYKKKVDNNNYCENKNLLSTFYKTSNIDIQNNIYPTIDTTPTPKTTPPSALIVKPILIKTSLSQTSNYSTITNNNNKEESNILLNYIDQYDNTKYNNSNYTNNYSKKAKIKSNILKNSKKKFEMHNFQSSSFSNYFSYQETNNKINKRKSNLEDKKRLPSNIEKYPNDILSGSIDTFNNNNYKIKLKEIISNISGLKNRSNDLSINNYENNYDHSTDNHYNIIYSKKPKIKEIKSVHSQKKIKKKNDTFFSKIQTSNSNNYDNNYSNNEFQNKHNTLIANEFSVDAIDIFNNYNISYN